MKSSFHPLKDTLIIYHTTKMNAILQNKPFKKNYLTTGKAEAACSGTTGIRGLGGRLFFNLLTGQLMTRGPSRCSWTTRKAEAAARVHLLKTAHRQLRSSNEMRLNVKIDL